MTPGPARILVVELLGGFGDLLIALPMVHALAASHPGARIDVVTVAAAVPLLAADPAVTEVRAADPARLRDWLADDLDRHRPDLVVSTTMHSGIDALLDERVPGSATNLWRRPPPDELIERRFVRLLVADGLVAPQHAGTPLRLVLTDAERAVGRSMLDALAPGERPLLVLPGSGMAVKRWPDARWAELVDRAARLALVPATEASRVPAAVPLPDLDLRALAGLAAAVGERGGAAVGGDTGPVRLATAAGCPAVGLFGPTLASRYGLSDPASVNLQGLPGCEVRRPTSITEQECWWSARCPLDPVGHRPRCMADLAVDDVLSALDRVGRPA